MASSTNHFASNLRVLRKKWEMSQEELAHALGLNRGNIASYERGSAEPKASKLVEMAHFFNIDLAHFIEQDLTKGVKNGKLDIHPLIERKSIKEFAARTEELITIVGGFKQFFALKQQPEHLENILLLQIQGDYARLLELLEEVLEENRSFANELLLH